jgi:hypothetical protein
MRALMLGARRRVPDVGRSGGCTPSANHVVGQGMRRCAGDGCDCDTSAAVHLYHIFEVNYAPPLSGIVGRRQLPLHVHRQQPAARVAC